MPEMSEALTPNERYVAELSREGLAKHVARYIESAGIHIENYRQFREDPDGNADGNQAYRCKFWYDMTMQSLSDAKTFATELQARDSLPSPSSQVRGQ